MTDQHVERVVTYTEEQRLQRENIISMIKEEQRLCYLRIEPLLKMLASIENHATIRYILSADHFMEVDNDD